MISNKRKRLFSLLLAFMMMFTVSASALDYTVQKGDNLWKIAKINNTTWQKLVTDNNIKIPSLIYPGQIIKIQTNNNVGDKTITIIGTSDMHSNIIGFNYEDDMATKNNGMARIYTYIQQVKSENPNVILLDNGDTIQGNILTDDIYNKKDGEHPAISVMNAMGYDAMVLGNHEFNFGLNLIKRIQSQAKFPILTANATNKKDNTLFLEPYKIVDISGVKVGIIGLTNPNAPRWDGDKVDALDFQALGETAKKYVDEIKNKVDVIVVAAHAGLAAEFDEEKGSDAAEKIIELAPEVDALLLGHFHTIIKEDRENVVIGAPRNAGRDVVRMDITLDSNNKIKDSKVDVIDMANIDISQKIVDLPIVQDAHKATQSFIKGGSGADGEASGGVFGEASKKFQPDDEIKGIPQGKLQDTAVVDLINKVQLANSSADVSAAALFKDTSDILQGPINYNTIFNIYKFDNTLCVVEVTAEELKNYMEWSVSSYNTWVEGDISISFNEDIPGYLYDMFAGVDYKIDLSKPAGNRIVDLKFKGEKLKKDKILKLAVNNYRYASALKAEKLVKANKIWESPNSIRDMLVGYITENKIISPEVDNNWSITGVKLDSPYKDEVIRLINEGKIKIPYNKSLNINQLLNDGIIKTKK